ncbi:hypothetical protein DRQ16_02450, partial [bacterium]
EKKIYVLSPTLALLDTSTSGIGRVRAVNDVNGDGAKEIIVYNDDVDEYRILDTNFNILYSFGQGIGWGDALITDLDMDGVNEIILNRGSEKCAIYKISTTGIKREERGEIPSLKMEVVPNLSQRDVRVVYELPHDGKVSIEIYNVSGRRVKELFRGYQKTGTHELIWDGRDEKGKKVPAGVYWIVVKGEGETGVRKMIKIH